MADASNPVVFFDVTIGGQDMGRLKMELFADVVPKTAENFRLVPRLPRRREGEEKVNVSFEPPSPLFGPPSSEEPQEPGQFCTGEYRKNGTPVGFKGAQFHRVIKDFMIQGGDFVNGDGTGIMSIYGEVAFPDENFKQKHVGAGLLSMANSGCNSNGCQFFITCTTCDFLDGKHVVFGKVIDGLLIMRKIENVPVGPNNRPKLPVIISQCGEM